MIKRKAILVHPIKACRGSSGIAPLILNLDTRLRCVQIQDPSSVLPGKEPRVTGWRGGSPRKGVDDLEKKKFTCPSWDSNPGSPGP